MLAFSLYVFRYNKFIYPISLSSESRYRTPRYARPLSGRVPPLSDLLLPSFTYISVSPLWLCCEYGKRFSTVSETTTNQHPAVHEGCRDTLTSVIGFYEGPRRRRRSDRSAAGLPTRRRSERSAAWLPILDPNRSAAWLPTQRRLHPTLPTWQHSPPIIDRSLDSLDHRVDRGDLDCDNQWLSFCLQRRWNRFNCCPSHLDCC